MAYSFTEKKRIRKSFAKRASVLPVPYLLATQINSYAQFLQADGLPDNRKTQGLQAAFQGGESGCDHWAGASFGRTFCRFRAKSNAIK